MSIDRDKFIDSLIQIQVNKQALKQLMLDRRNAEEALSVEYKVSEINSKRQQIAADYDAQMAVLNSQITDLENSLGQ